MKETKWWKKDSHLERKHEFNMEEISRENVATLDGMSEEDIKAQLKELEDMLGAGKL
jgi:hypothetical protein